MKTPQDYVQFLKDIRPELPKAVFDFLLSSLEEYGKQCEEKGRSDAVDYILKNITIRHAESGTEMRRLLESARHSSNK